MAIELRVTGIAAGGDAIARESGGRVVFVTGALPGERVTAEVTEERKDFARAVAVEVLEPASGRRSLPCPHGADGCGGCGWLHVDPPTQHELKARIVEDALRRVGHVEGVTVGHAAPLPDAGFRTTVRAVVRDGRAGFRRAASHDPVLVESCLVAHPLVEELLVEGRFGAAREVTVRAGARTGERLVIAAPTASGVSVPPDVRVVGEDDLRRGRRAWFHEEAAGRRWRISAASFFQTRPDGADALVAEAAQAAAGVLGGGRTLVDLCAGVGLFAGALGEEMEVVAVERQVSSVADARVNLADRPARVVRSAMERWRPSPADLVIADPARSGLGRAGVDRVAATGAARVVLVSCDAAALGRDAGLLTAAGYRLVDVTLVDLFPNTPHVEVVSRFDRHPESGSAPNNRSS
jgi:23S rRNA (uracil1939-C5)-methyltransferase